MIRRTRRALGLCALLCFPGWAEDGKGPADGGSVAAPTRPALVLEVRADTVIATGTVASETHGAMLSAALTRRFPGRTLATSFRTRDRLDADWQLQTLAAVDAAAEIASGNLILTQNAVELEGIAREDSLLDVRLDRLRQLTPGSFVVNRSLRKPATPSEHDRACATMFASIRGEPVRFRSGTTELRSSSLALLDRYANHLADCPGTRLEITGHTDAAGEPELNQSLSERRAAQVADYLIAAGVPADSLSHRGVGSSEPIAGNDTAWGRSKNRRIEIRKLNDD